MIVRFASATSRPSSETSSLAELIAGPSPVYASPSKSVGRLHGAHDRQVERLGEVPVALVLPGHGHDRAGAVVGQHVVGGVDRDLLAVDRVGRRGTPRKTPVFGRSVASRSISVALRTSSRYAVERRALLVGDAARRPACASAATTKNVAPNSVSGRVVKTVTGSSRALAIVEVDVRALGPADPVALHGQHPLGPGALQRLHVVQQPLGVVGDLEVPLRQLALGHLGAAALAHARRRPARWPARSGRSGTS